MPVRLSAFIMTLKNKVEKYEHARQLKTLLGSLRGTYRESPALHLPQEEENEIKRVLEQCKRIEGAIDRNLPEKELMEMITASRTVIFR